jgi:hypothetical protein
MRPRGQLKFNLMLDASYLLDSRGLENITFVLEEKIGTLRPNEIRDLFRY